MKYAETHSILWDVATATLASDLSSSSSKSEPDTDLESLHSWASCLTGESRDLGWVMYRYIWPDSVQRVKRLLQTMTKGIVCLAGLQGIGKTSALRALFYDNMLRQNRSAKNRSANPSDYYWNHDYDAIIFKWRRELFRTVPVSVECGSVAFEAICSEKLGRRRYENMSVGLSGGRMGRAEATALREEAWVEMLSRKSLILIDLPDYSKTDRRLMARDLSQIYWLWNTLISQDSDANLVIAVQKEMLGNHFFFNKMRIVEIESLNPDQIVRVYLQTFHGPHPFTNEALTALAIMSRGIFRRFLRYVTLTLESWEILSEPRQPIDPALVKQTITIDRLAEDMERELAELFPKQSDLRLQAVRLLMRLEESGPKKQTELVEELGMEDYAMSRLLTKLGLHRYVVRRREGTDKIVSLREER